MVVVPEPGALTQVLGTHNTQSIRLDNDRFNLRVGANAYATGPANSLPANLPHIVAVTDGATDDPPTRVWINGDPQSLTYSGAGSGPDVRYFAAPFDAIFYVGGTDWTGDRRSYRGLLAEVILYDRVLSELEHHRMGVYLQNKYAIPTVYRELMQGTLFVVH